MSILTDTTLHMWSPASQAIVGEGRSYGVCGVVVGRFTSRREEVTCPTCITLLDNKENDSGA